MATEAHLKKSIVDFIVAQPQRGPEELLPFYEDMGPAGVRDYWNRINKLSIEGKETGI